MKKNYVYALMSAVALLGAVSLSACSSSDDVVDVNPTFDGEAVKTQFTISLPFDNNASTRQTSDIVQEGAQNGTTTDLSKFRGINNIVLIPFSNPSASERTSRLGENVVLGEDNMLKPTPTSQTGINGENSIPSGKLLTSSNAVLYKDVTIPVGTSAFIFYGKAPETDGKEFEEGRLTAAGLTGQTSGISFTPTPILTADPDIAKGTALATYVSSIAGVNYVDDKGTTDDTSDDETIYFWAGCSNSANSTKPWYNAGLGEMYTAFTSMKAGASSYVQAAVLDLYKSVYKNTDDVSKAITAAITKNTYASPVLDGESKPTGELSFTEAISGYPENINMPEGAAALTWNTATPKVATAVANANFGDETHLGSMNLVNMSSIVYPASLYYFVDSDIKTSDASRIGDYDGEKNWTTILSGYSGTSVSSATRSVAITKSVEYAVGRLDVTVNKLDKSGYYDRNGEKITIPSGGYELTGVLIGGQKAVDYKFTQTGSEEYTIYDKTINSTSTHNYVTASANATTTYTLALETAATQSVYVALEFLNSGEDFQGFDGVVKKGCKFYMIAKLDPNSVTKPDEYTGGVFMQDYKTIAGFTFGAGSTDTATPGGFANAYTTIPDLRTPQLELGLSVNLEWKPGITFAVEF